MNNENLGPAERIINALLQYSDHMVHNRPGMVVTDARFNTGVRWEPVTHKVENDQKVVYKLVKAGKKTNKVRVGVMRDDNKIVEAGAVVAEYRPAGLYPEVAAWMYSQVAEVWKLDNEFAARWASYAFGQEHRDLKVVLAAFMLVQSRKGDPVVDAGKVAFYDEDFRDVGEAMMLMRLKDKDLNPKLLLRIHELLTQPKVAAINRELGFGRSARNAFYGRWDKAVMKWLQHREENPKLLEGLVKAGFRTSVMALVRLSGFKPSTPKFFETLRWKQSQADDGRRQIAIGIALKAADTWDGLTEVQICERITREKLNFKRVVGLLPKGTGLTRAIVAASIEAGGFSSKDLLQYTPTLEDLGLLQVQDIRTRWENAIKSAEDMRAANIALRVKSKETAEKLVEAGDNAVKKAVEEVTRGIRIYFIVDISASMDGAIQEAKTYIAKFLQGFPPERLHVSVFNTAGREIKIQHASAAGVENAFRGIRASGGTSYGEGVKALKNYKPAADEDAIFIFVGDEEQHGTFEQDIRASGLNPVAFGFLKVRGNMGFGGTFANRHLENGFAAVRNTAARLGIPCFMIAPETFSDVYAIPRTIRNLMAATPVGAATVDRPAPVRVTLVDTILKTDILKKPVWAA